MLAYVIIAIVTLLYLVLAYFVGSWLHLQGSSLWILRSALWVVGLVAAGVFVWFWYRAHRDSQQEATSGDSADAALIKDALKRLRSITKKGTVHFGDLPVLMVLGESRAAKTTTVLRSGLDPNLLAGQVYQGDIVVPTEVANFWYTKSALFVELSAAFLAQTARLRRMVQSMERSAVFSAARKRIQAVRAVVLCVNLESFLTADADTTASARRVNVALQQIADTIGMNVPVYVLFTKLDRIANFAEYVRDLTAAEAAEVLGTTLQRAEEETHGVYADERTALLDRCFDELTYSLSEKRTDLLPRGSDSQQLAGVYEFPREFRKLKNSIVRFLVEALKPSHAMTNPRLRGFYFCGVRAVLEQQTAPAAAGAVASGEPASPDATMFFNPSAMKTAQAAVQPAPQTRKVPHWTFLPQFLPEVVLKDQIFAVSEGPSTRVKLARRIEVAVLAAIALICCLGITTSFLENRALRLKIAALGSGISTNPVVEPTLPAVQELQELDDLRSSIQLLQTYNRESAPWGMRWGLYSGEELEVKARALYFSRFWPLLFGDTENRLAESLRRLPDAPATPNDEYETPYRALKAYLITTSNHEKSTKDFLSPLLYRLWVDHRNPDPDTAKLVQQQFDFYSTELVKADPYNIDQARSPVAHARSYLSKFDAVRRIYRSLLDDISRGYPTITFDRDIVKSSHPVEGAFSKAGWSAMQDRITKHQFLSGEEWVLGEHTSSPLDPTTMEQRLSPLYHDDFENQWREFLAQARVSHYDLHDASAKLSVLASGNASPLLDIFAVVSENTTVKDPEASDISAPKGVFQPPASVVPPPGNPRVLTGPSNEAYRNALTTLALSMQQVAANQKDAASTSKAQGDAANAKAAVMQLRANFLPDHAPDPRKAVDKTTFELLLAPITTAESTLNGVGPQEANAAGQTLCRQFNTFAGLYPFSPASTKGANIQDVNTFFAPGGALSKFYEETYKTYVVQNGSEFIPGPNGGRLNRGFLAFFNNVMHFKDTVYGSGTQPQFSFTLRPGTMDGLNNVAFDMTGQSLASGSSPRSFVWHFGDLDQITVTGDTFEYLQYKGPWALFHFFNEADTMQANGNIYSVSWIPKTSGQPMKKNGTPIVIRYELDLHGAPPIVRRDYLQQHLHCDPAVLH